MPIIFTFYSLNTVLWKPENVTASIYTTRDGCQKGAVMIAFGRKKIHLIKTIIYTGHAKHSATTTFPFVVLHTKYLLE